MAGKMIPFRYRAGKTVLHRAPAGLKLLAVMMLGAAAYVSIYGLAAAIALLLAASIAARIPPWELLKGARMLVLVSLCVMLLNYQTPVIGLITALRIFVPFAAAALLFAVTTMRELRLSLGALELRLRNIFIKRKNITTEYAELHGVKDGFRIKNSVKLRDLRGFSSLKSPRVAFFSLGISLMLGFIPRFFELWETANLACDARLCKRGPRRLPLLVPLVTERMMEAAADTALALEARGLGVE